MKTNTIVQGLFRIPALAWDQGLILLFDARLGVDDLPAPIDIWQTTSADGLHWSTPEPAITQTGHRGVGDASVIGGNLAFHGLSDLSGFFEDPTDLQPCIARREAGRWASTSISYLFSDVDAAFASSGTGLILDDGRWLQSFVVRRGTEISLRVIASDGTAADIAGANESSIAQLPDGTIVLHSRGVGNRLSSFSTDGGATFSPLEVEQDLVDPGCNGHVFYWKSQGALATTHLADPHLRRHLVMDISYDAGATWTHRITITRAEAAYSTAVEMPNGDVAVVWEAEGTRAIKCTVVSAADIQARIEEPLEDIASLRHIVPVEASESGIEVPLPEAAQWGEGVFKIVSDPHADTQLIRTRDHKPRHHLKAGDQLVFDIRRGGAVTYGVSVDYDGRPISEIGQALISAEKRTDR